MAGHQRKERLRDAPCSAANVEHRRIGSDARKAREYL
jgi:hypothetical protein